MSIINRELHPTQRRHALQLQAGNVATGVTTIVGVVGNDGLVMSAYSTAVGLSGTPTVSFSLYRFNTTGGFTAIGLGATITVPAFGTSGIAAATLIGGVTCLRGDLVAALSGGTNASTTTQTLAVALQPQVDFLAFPGT
jgi:hypothetical protein